MALIETLTVTRAYGFILHNRVFDELSDRSNLDSLAIEFDSDLTEWLGLVEMPNQFDDFAPRDHVAPDVAMARQNMVRRIPQCLQKFRNLKRLTLLCIWGLVDEWQTPLLNILRLNPGLEHLALSFSHGAVERADKDGDRRLKFPQRRYFRFFADICHRYGNIEQNRLKLRSLRLDRHISFPALSCLERLTLLMYLKDAHLVSE